MQLMEKGLRSIKEPGDLGKGDEIAVLPCLCRCREIELTPSAAVHRSTAPVT